MLNKSLLITSIILSLNIACAAPEYNIDYVGTPPGFYDDITPEDIEREEREEQERLNKQVPKQNSDISTEQNEDESEEIIIPPQKTKATKNYSQIYANLTVPDFSYLHNKDPEEFYDVKDATWSVYPLLRLISPIYFKNVTIEPGYYLLTPREHKGNWYILFKQNGVVMHIIPVFDREYTPESFYDEHIPQPKLTRSQKIHMGFLDFLGKFDSTKRKEPVQSYLEVNDVENHLVTIIIYYGGHKYSTIFRTLKL